MKFPHEQRPRLRLRVKLAAALCALYAAAPMLVPELLPDAYVMAAEHAATNWWSDYDALLVGELHGTKEYPKAFLDFVRAAVSHRVPLIVGVELADEDVDAALLASGMGSGQRETALRKSAFWAQARDGRSSAAYFDLVTRLGELAARKSIVLVGLDNRVTGTEPFAVDAYARLQSALQQMDASARKRAKFVLLAGNQHVDSGSAQNDLAFVLRDRRVKALAVRPGTMGGESWSCVDGSCGPHAVGKSMGCDAATPTMTPIDFAAPEADRPLCLGAVSVSAPAIDDPRRSLTE